jgi:hypothetical protein
MIVKIQRPLMTNGNSVPMALIYDQNRNLHEMLPYFEIEELFAVDDGEEPPLKVYHDANLSNGILHIGERVEDQDW